MCVADFIYYCISGFHRNSGIRFTYGNDPEIFSISIMEKVPENRNSGTIFFRKTEISGTLFRNYGSLRNSGTFRKFPQRSGISFRKFSGKSFRKFPVSGTVGTIITLKSYICKYNTNNISMDARR